MAHTGQDPSTEGGVVLRASLCGYPLLISGGTVRHDNPGGQYDFPGGWDWDRTEIAPEP